MISLEYVNPLAGGPVVSTFSCEMPPSLCRCAYIFQHKQGSSIYVVFLGYGSSVINGVRFNKDIRDV